MVPGDRLSLNVYRQTIANAAATGKTSANFTIQGYADGVATTLTVTSITEGATIGPVGDQWRAYLVIIAAIPATAAFDQIEIFPDNSDIVSPNTIAGEIQAYDLDSLANLMQDSTGVPAVASAVDTELGQIVDGDSYVSGTLTMNTSKLSPFGITDLSAVGITVEAAIAATPGGTQYPITITTISPTLMTYTLSWTAQQHPALTTDQQKVWYIDVQVIKTGPPKLIVTTGRFRFTEVWQRDSRTT